MGNGKIATGVVRTTHGVHGHLKVKVFSDEVEHFLGQKVLCLRNERSEVRVEVEHSELAGDRILLKLKGIETPEAGRRFNGWYIYIDREDAAPLEEDEYYLADLVGCSVYYEQELLGEVVSAVEGAQAELLEVRRSGTEELTYLPFMDVYVKEVDAAGRRIDLRNRWIIDEV